jgi:LysM repeat protein
MPIVRSLAVGLDRAGPAEQHDLSRFCGTEIHAARVGAYMHGRRYLSTHTAAVTLIPGNHTGRINQGDIVVVRLPLVTGREADGLISDWYAVESVAPSADGSEALTLSHFPVDSLARSLLALQVANAVAPGALLPFPAIGACDVAGRSADTSVPASSTSGTPFSSGGSGISATPPGGYGGGGVPGGGGGGYYEAPIPDNGPPSEEAPKSPPVNPATPGGPPTPTNEPPSRPPGYEDVCPAGFWGLSLEITYLTFSGFFFSYGSVTRNVRTFDVTPNGSQTVNLGSQGIAIIETNTLKLVLTDGTTETLQVQASPNLLGVEYPFVIESGPYQCLLGNGSPGPSVPDRRYVVRPGDTLEDIARKVLGDPSRWPEIYNLNRPKIENPDLIYPGQVLQIPAS